MRPEAVAVFAALASLAGVVAWRRAAASGGQGASVPPLDARQVLDGTWTVETGIEPLPEIGEPGTGIGGQLMETVTRAPAQPASMAVDWSKVEHFEPHEFKGQLDSIASRLVYALDAYREALGSRVIVSPHPRALARFDGSTTSRHYAVGRLADAADVMAPGRSLREQYEAAASVDAIGAIGVYPHWRPHAGLHIDTRPRKASGARAEWRAFPTEDGQDYVALDWSAIA